MISYFLSLGAGALTALSPCILPVLPIMAASSRAKHKTGPIFISLGLVSSLVVMGVVFSSLTQVLGLEEESIRTLSAWLLVAFGIILTFPKLKEVLSHRFERLGSSATQVSYKLSPDSSAGQFGIGFLMGAAWSPCIGPTLGVALGLASGQGSQTQGVMMMFLFGLGLSLPLLAISYGLRGYITRNRTKLLKFNQFGSQVMGVTLTVTGMLLVTGGATMMEAYLTSHLPHWFLRLSSSL